MAERLERESCDCKTCVWSMGPGCWSLESYLLTPPLNQVKNASSSFFSLFLHVSFFERSLNTGNTEVLVVLMYVNYNHQLTNMILLNNSLHHNIIQPPVNRMPRVCALIDQTFPIPKSFKPRRTRSTTSVHCRAGCGGSGRILMESPLSGDILKYIDRTIACTASYCWRSFRNLLDT